jgi:hypothetical protein
MGNKTTRRRQRRQETSRPSIFFIVTLTIGLLLLVVIAYFLISRPTVKQGSTGRSGAAVLAAAAGSDWIAGARPHHSRVS